MTHWSDGKANVPAAVRHRLLKLAKSEGLAFDLVALRYATERLLYRLSRSEHRARFVLKGAWLFHLWGMPRRITRDVDLLGRGHDSVEGMEETFRRVSQQDVTPDDGLRFDPASVEAQEIREAQEYSGVRVRLTAYLGTARVRVQVDIGFGDALTGPRIRADIPVLLDYPRPELQVYSREASIAEKLEAMVRFGARTGRMKDYFDLLTLSREHGFEGPALLEQIVATFDRRETALPAEVPAALTEEFGAGRQAGWTAFLKDSDGKGAPDRFSDVVAEIRDFIWPVLTAAAKSQPFPGRWVPASGWTSSSPEASS